MPEQRNAETLLLDLHLERLSHDDKAWLQAELLHDAGLRAKSDKLGNLLRPLDHWTAPQPSTNLADRILAAVKEADATPVSDENLTFTQAKTERFFRAMPVRSLKEFLAIAACIALIATVAIPAIYGVRAQAQLSQCTSNLGSIFQGVRLYQAAFGGALPYAGNEIGASWLPGSDSGAPYMSNSRHVYLLTKLNYGPQPEHFACPCCSTSEAMQHDQLASHNDFAQGANITYASLNMAGTTPNLRPRGAIAYMSDANPMFVDGRFDAKVNPMSANSPTHGGRGQTVLTLDGTVRQLTTPNYGTNKDNLWMAGDIRYYNGTETPATDDDAFLIQGYPVTDLKLITRSRRQHY